MCETQPSPSPVTATPLLRLYGFGLGPHPYFQMLKQQQPTRWLSVAGSVSLAIVSLMVYGLAVSYLSETVSFFFSCLLAVAWILLLVGNSRQKAAWQKQTQNAWKAYAAKTEGGLTTDIYPDCVKQWGVHFCETVPLNAHTLWEETADWLILENGAHRLVIRAEDLSAVQAMQLGEILHGVIPAERHRIHTPFRVMGQTPAPPPFRVDPPLCYERLTATAVAEAQSEAFGHRIELCGGSIIFALLFTFLFQITPWVPLDFFLFFAAFFVAIMGIGRLLNGKSRPTPREVSVAVTGDGLQIFDNGVCGFAAAPDVQATRTATGAVLHTPVGDYAFLWNTVQNRQQLEWMLFGHSDR